VSPRNSARTVALFAQVGGAVDALPIPCGTYQSRTWDLAVSPACLYSLLRLVDLINEMRRRQASASCLSSPSWSISQSGSVGFQLTSAPAAGHVNPARHVVNVEKAEADRY
jgi:hypothetical protein